MKVNNGLFKYIPRDVMEEAGKNLGILRGKTFVLGSEDESPILADHSIHDIYRNGQNSVDRCLEKSPYPADSDEQRILEGLKEALFSVFIIRDIERGVGVVVEDILHGGRHLIVDISMSQSGVLGLVFVGRIFTVDGITMTTGAFLPLGLAEGWKGQALLDQVKEQWQKEVSLASPKETVGKHHATLLRTALQMGAGDHVRFTGPEGESSPGPRQPRQLRGGRVGRNDPCPCGSGKKYKHCCMKRS